jgi:hypothetical protein
MLDRMLGRASLFITLALILGVSLLVGTEKGNEILGVMWTWATAR